MKAPKMILFDYGQTLVNEGFDGIRGTEAVLQYAVKNKYNRSAEEIQAVANQMNQELGRFDPERRHLFQIEVPNRMFTSYLYRSLGIELSIGPEDIDHVFWEAAAPGTLTDGIADFLDFLTKKGIRTGVISNISYAGAMVEKRINHFLPGNEFEFILATSEYMYRKPNRRIFELALEMADLKPEDVWYVGDNYKCDVEGAAGAGLFPVWYTGAIDTPADPKETVLTIRHWSELQKLIGSQSKEER